MSNMLIVAGLLGTVVTVIKAVEARSVEADTKGEEKWTGTFKRELALTIIEDLYNQTKPAVAFSVIRETLASTISATVAIYNALGAFRKK
jgi:SRSO17 transposase